jgi:hypothetical protein
VSGRQEGIALAVKMSSGPARDAAGQLYAIVGPAHAPAGRLGWFSYGGTARVVLAVVLVAAATGVAGAGLRLRVPVHLPRPGRTARTAVLATWGLLIVAYLICLGFYAHLLIAQHLVHSRPRLPILPITAACMVALFCGIWYMGRSLSDEARLGSAFTVP